MENSGIPCGFFYSEMYTDTIVLSRSHVKSGIPAGKCFKARTGSPARISPTSSDCRGARLTSSDASASVRMRLTAHVKRNCPAARTGSGAESEF